MLGDGEYGCKTLVSQGCEYHEAAQCHPHNFEPPRVVFLFTGQVLPSVSAALDAVHVHSESLDQVLHGTSTLFQCSEVPSSLSLPSSAQHYSEGLLLSVTVVVLAFIQVVFLQGISWLTLHVKCGV